MTTQSSAQNISQLEGEEGFQKVQGYKLDIKLAHPQQATKHVMQAHGTLQSLMDR